MDVETDPFSLFPFSRNSIDLLSRRFILTSFVIVVDFDVDVDDVIADIGVSAGVSSVASALFQ